MVDIDGVISLFGGVQWRAWSGEVGDDAGGQLDGSFHLIDGTPHFLSSIAAAHLLELADVFDSFR